MMKLTCLLYALFLLTLGAFAQTTYTLGTNRGGTTFICLAASKYPVSSPYQFNCNVVPLILNGTQVGNLQLMNAGGWIMVHAPGIAENQKYLESKFAPDMSQFSTPSTAGPGKVVWKYQIIDANNNLWHGTISAPWDDTSDWRGWQYPQLLTKDSSGNSIAGTLTVEAGPLP